jgi:hypothetical protein
MTQTSTRTRKSPSVKGARINSSWAADSKAKEAPRPGR